MNHFIRLYKSRDEEKLVELLCEVFNSWPNFRFALLFTRPLEVEVRARQLVAKFRQK